MAESQIWNYFTMYNGVAPTIFMPEVGKLITGKPTQSDLDLRKYNQKDEASLSDDESIIMYGKNFNRLTLEGSHTNKDSKIIVDSLLQGTSGTNSVLFVDIDGGITGVPLAAADREEVSCAVCYTTDPCSKQQLIRNANTYSLSDSTYIVDNLPSEKIDWNCICHIGKKSRVNIEKFLIYNGNNVMRVLYSGKFNGTGRVDDRYEIRKIKDYTLFINKKVPDEFSYSQAPVASLQFNKEYSQRFFNETETKDLRVEYSAEEIHDKSYMKAGLWKELCIGVPKPKYTMENTSKWLFDIQKMVKYVIKKIYPDLDAEEVDNVTDMNLIKKFWARAFIHLSVSAQNNYENLETVGDAVFKASFFTHIIMRYPTIEPSSIDNMKGMYLSTTWFSRFCREMGLNDWIASNFTITDKICEDVMESFVGALYLAGNSVDDGLGMILSNKFVNIIASDLDLFKTDDIGYGPKKTVVTQYGNKLGLGDDWLNVSTRNNRMGGARFSTFMKIKPRALEFLSDASINISNLDKTFSSTGDDKNSSELGAYTNIYYALKNAGVTFEWVDERQQIRKRSRSKLIVSLYGRVIDKASAEYSSVKLKTYMKDADIFIGAILMGEKTLPDGSKKYKNLATYEIAVNNLTNNNERTMLAESGVLRKYLGS